MKKALICLTVLAIAHVACAEQVSLRSLLADMTDRALIAEFPDAGFTCKQVSSYDRKSKTPGNADWFANDDWSNFIRCEETAGRREWVLMDEAGPGAIVRWWITGFSYNGVIRVYLDGAEEPVFSGKADELIGGKLLLGAPLCEETSRGRNLYLPIPYAKHCKITYDGPHARETNDFADNLYYNINYRTYPAGTSIKTFTMEDIRANAALIDATQKKLLEPQAYSATKQIDAITESLESGESFLTKIDGPAAISCIRVRVKARDLPQAMRSVVISAEFDGEKTVWAPVGDFFGTGAGLNPFKGWWREVKNDGWMSCYWPMPFEKSAIITLTNCGRESVSAELGRIDIADWQWTKNSMHFCSAWHSQNEMDVPGPDFNYMREWNYVTVRGKGLYAGDTLSLFNRANAWWGEGDEKIFVDGESFPSHFGTGTEDYFGYAWASGAYFTSPFHAQPNGAGNDKTGFVTNTRVRLLDGIPFEKSLRFDMELHHWQRAKIDYATTAYFYAIPGAKANGETAPEKAAEKVGKVRLVLEGEKMQLRLVTGGLTENQQGDWGASGRTHLLWKDAAVGDELAAAFNVPQSGEYEMTLQMLTAFDYGRFQILLDGKELFAAEDFYVREGVHLKQLPCGVKRLEKGEHKISLRVLQPNPDAKPNNLAGLDYIELKTAE